MYVEDNFPFLLFYVQRIVVQILIRSTYGCISGISKKGYLPLFQHRFLTLFANRTARNIPKPSNSSAKNPRTFVAIFTIFASIHKQTRILSSIVQIVSYRFENLWNRARKQLSHYFFNTTAILIS